MLKSQLICLSLSLSSRWKEEIPTISKGTESHPRGQKGGLQVFFSPLKTIINRSQIFSEVHACKQLRVPSLSCSRSLLFSKRLTGSLRPSWPKGRWGSSDLPSPCVQLPLRTHNRLHTIAKVRAPPCIPCYVTSQSLDKGKR